MNIEDLKVGQTVASREIPTDVGVVERIDYDDDMVYVRFPTSRGTDLLDLDPADLIEAP